MKSVLFVCLGNICRSPLAEAIAKREASRRGYDITIDSAGTGSWHIGETPCANSQKVAKQRGLDISSYRGRQVCSADFDKFDIVIGLDSSNVSNLKKLGCSKAKLLGEYGANGEDVPDPYFFDGFEGFDRVFDMIDRCVVELFEREFTDV